MSSKQYSENTLSLAIFISAAVWGLYWIPLRAIENLGIPGSWTVPFFNACPLLVLIPIFILYFKKIQGNWKVTFSASIMIGFAFSFYAYGLLETTVIRATLLFYLSPIWSTVIGVIWLKEKFTKARVISMKDGQISQVGTPEEIVANPIDKYVSDFTEDVPRYKVLSAGKVMRATKQKSIPKGYDPILDNAKIDSLIDICADSDIALPVTCNHTGKILGEIDRSIIMKAMNSRS